MHSLGLDGLGCLNVWYGWCFEMDNDDLDRFGDNDLSDVWEIFVEYVDMQIGGEGFADITDDECLDAAWTGVMDMEG